jgi:hypothetical protein
MTVFLIFDAADDDGTVRHKTLVNTEAIIGIDPIGPRHCRLIMQSFPSRELCVIGTLEELQVKLNIACA